MSGMVSGNLSMKRGILTRLRRATSMAFDATRKIDKSALSGSQHLFNLLIIVPRTSLHVHSHSGLSGRARSSLSRL